MDRIQLIADLFSAFQKASRHKRGSAAQVKFEMGLEQNIVQLADEILGRTYQSGPCTCFITNHPVKREIFASSFRDRVVHHLLHGYLSSLFEPRFIYDSYSCRIGKGTQMGIERIEHHIRSCSRNYTSPAYVLKLDLKGYFMSINRQRLLASVLGAFDRALQKEASREPYPEKAFSGQMESTISNFRKGFFESKGIDAETVRYLIRTIILRDPAQNCYIKGKRSDWLGLPDSKSLLRAPQGYGLPVGDLTSQLFSNIFLNEFDWWVKKTLHCKHYGRYTDDFYIIHEDVYFLKALIPRIRTFLKDSFGLTLHPRKIVLQNCRTKAFSYLGAVILPYHRYPVRRTVGFFKVAMRRIDKFCFSEGFSIAALPSIRAVLNSYLGYLSHFRSYKLRARVISRTRLVRFFAFSPSLTHAKIFRKYRLKPLPTLSA